MPMSIAVQSGSKDINKNTPQERVNDQIKRIEDEIKKTPNMNKKRVKRLRGWIKWAKRGFTRVVCPPLLEDIVIELAREQCALGDQHVPDINGPWRRS